MLCLIFTKVLNKHLKAMSSTLTEKELFDRYAWDVCDALNETAL